MKFASIDTSIDYGPVSRTITKVAKDKTHVTVIPDPQVGSHVKVISQRRCDCGDLGKVLQTSIPSIIGAGGPNYVLVELGYARDKEGKIQCVSPYGSIRKYLTDEVITVKEQEGGMIL